MSKKVTNVKQIIIEKGSIMNIGFLLMSAGVAFFSNKEYIWGLAGVAAGAGLIYWREKLKKNARWA